MSVAYGSQQQAAQQPPPQHPPPMNQQQQGHRIMPPSRAPAGMPPASSAQIQKILDENCGLIQTIQEYQNVGKLNECMTYHQALHRNLVYLAQLADSTQNIAQILPPPHILQQMPPMHSGVTSPSQMPPHHPNESGNCNFPSHKATLSGPSTNQCFDYSKSGSAQPAASHEQLQSAISRPPDASAGSAAAAKRSAAVPRTAAERSSFIDKRSSAAASAATSCHTSNLECATKLPKQLRSTASAAAEPESPAHSASGHDAFHCNDAEPAPSSDACASPVDSANAAADATATPAAILSAGKYTAGSRAMTAGNRITFGYLKQHPPPSPQQPQVSNVAQRPGGPPTPLQQNQAQGPNPNSAQAPVAPANQQTQQAQPGQGQQQQPYRGYQQPQQHAHYPGYGPQGTFSSPLSAVSVADGVFSGQNYQPGNYPGAMPPYGAPQNYQGNAGPQVYHHGMPPAASHQPTPGNYPPPAAGQPLYGPPGSQGQNMYPQNAGPPPPMNYPYGNPNPVVYPPNVYPPPQQYPGPYPPTSQQGQSISGPPHHQAANIPPANAMTGSTNYNTTPSPSQTTSPNNSTNGTQSGPPTQPMQQQNSLPPPAQPQPHANIPQPNSQASSYQQQAPPPAVTGSFL